MIQYQFSGCRVESPDRRSPITDHQSPILADCHLHFEGCLPRDFLQRLARRATHLFADLEAFEARRRSVRDDAGFLSLFAEVCSLFRRPEDYGDAARAIGESLARDGVAYAEIYVSPAILSRMALDGARCLEAIDEAFRARPGGCDCRILLDVVRQWGPESAERVLDLHERNPMPSVVGFGMGGDEKAVPVSAFAGVYMRARALGLKTSVHAGEWAGPESLEEALDVLRPDRVDRRHRGGGRRAARRAAGRRTHDPLRGADGKRGDGSGEELRGASSAALDRGRRARGALRRRPASLRHDDGQRIPRGARAVRPRRPAASRPRGERLARRVLLAGAARRRHPRPSRLGPGRFSVIPSRASPVILSAATALFRSFSDVG